MSRLQPEPPASARGFGRRLWPFRTRAPATLLIDDQLAAILHCGGATHRFVNEAGDAGTSPGPAPRDWSALIQRIRESVPQATGSLRIAVGPLLAPVLTLRSLPGRLGDRDWNAYASHRLSSILGDRAGDHTFRVQGDGDEVRLASAMPTALIAACADRASTGKRRRIQVSLVPSIALAIGLGAAMRRPRSEPYWIVAAMARTVQGALIRSGLIQVTLPFDRVSVIGGLEGHLGREAVLLGEASPERGVWVDLGASMSIAADRPVAFSLLQPFAETAPSSVPLAAPIAS